MTDGSPSDQIVPALPFVLAGMVLVAVGTALALAAVLARNLKAPT